jgi:chromosome segregation ATPase
MSDIQRFIIYGPCVYTPAVDGEWMRYDDHRAEFKRLTVERDEARARVHWFKADLTEATTKVKRVIAERDEAQGTIYRLAGERDATQVEVERLTNKLNAHSEVNRRLIVERDAAEAERDAAQAEVERLTARHSEMETHITCLTNELHRTRAHGITLRWAEGEVEQLTAQRDAAEAEVDRLKELLAEESKSLPKLIDSMTSQLRATADRVTAERDAAQAEVQRLTAERDEAMAERDAAQREPERLQDLLTLAGQELSTLRDRLRVLQPDPSDQLDKALAEVERLTSQVATLTVGMEWADKLQAYAEAAEAETVRVVADGNKALAEVERLTGERDAALAEVERLIAERDTAQANVKWLIDRGNGKASLHRSRATDEDIWREVFMQQIFDYDTVEGLNEKMHAADVALAQYRKRWPR